MSAKGLKESKEEFQKTWESVFQKLHCLKADEPLNIEEISFKPDHPLVKLILTIYTWESFVYRVLNKALRESDLSMAATLGPYAGWLTYIVNRTQKMR